MEMSAEALQSTLNEIFTSLGFNEGDEKAEGGVDDDVYYSDADNGETVDRDTSADKTEDGSAGDANSSIAESEMSTTANKQPHKPAAKKMEDPSYKSVTLVSTGECTLDIDFHGVIPDTLEHLRHKKLRATFSFVPSVEGSEGTLVIMKAVTEPKTDKDDQSKQTNRSPEFPSNMEYLVRRQPHDYPKLYMEPLTEIEIGVLMNFPREPYRPLSLTVGWLHWKSGRFRTQDPHNHIPITGLNGSTVDIREIYREVTRQFSAYCRKQRVHTISFSNDQEIFFALGFFSDSHDARFFIRRLVDNSGSLLTLYQFLMLHDSLNPGRKRLYVWTATRRKGARKM